MKGFLRKIFYSEAILKVTESNKYKYMSTYGQSCGASSNDIKSQHSVSSEVHNF